MGIVAAASLWTVLVRVTWAMAWICARMLFVVVRPILRLPKAWRWLQVLLVAVFVAVFFYRPAVAYYWFWGSVLAEVAGIVLPLLFGKHNSLRAWLAQR
jgi:hypothetical protein